ncbi:MAG TPA: hypothetical protein VKB56_03690, partial [Terriglobales bacterium]|nr:hypothetical protein [Terriglobales bacterium]
MSSSAQIRDITFAVPEAWHRVERWSLIAGIVGAIACIIGAIIYPADHFLRAYLVGFMFWLGITL